MTNRRNIYRGEAGSPKYQGIAKVTRERNPFWKNKSREKNICISWEWPIHYMGETISINGILIQEFFHFSSSFYVISIIFIPMLLNNNMGYDEQQQKLRIFW